MSQGKRDRLSTEQRIDMWRRWKAGESLHEIGRVFGKGHGSIQFLLTQRGGGDSSCCSSAFAANCLPRRWPSGKTSHEELLPVRRFVRSLTDCSGLCRR